MIRHLCELCRKLFHRKRVEQELDEEIAGTSIDDDRERAVWHDSRRSTSPGSPGFRGRRTGSGECFATLELASRWTP